ncbi:MAG: cupin domain-containing protein, partial [Candidatus Latescibacterota bacterium]
MQTIRDVETTTYYLKDDGVIPNSPNPLLVYPGAIDVDRNGAMTIERIFAANTWDRSWRNGIYSFHHYHSTAHEVLGIAKGYAKVQMGGPHGVTFSIQAGDVMVIPAGVGHKNLGASADLLVIGSYPPGPSWD